MVKEAERGKVSEGERRRARKEFEWETRQLLLPMLTNFDDCIVHKESPSGISATISYSPSLAILCGVRVLLRTLVFAETGP